MPHVAASELFRDASAAGTAFAAFNVITLEHAEATVQGAERAGLPVTLQLSQNAIAYHGGNPRPIAAAMLALANSARVPVSLHLDHIEDGDLFRLADEIGFDSAMLDASQLPDRENVAATRSAVEWARSRGIWVEAELGRIGGKGGAHTPGVRTDPDEAREFVAQTGVDSLAVAVGSEHAMKSRSAAIDTELVARLAATLPVPLVLHGSSGVPDDQLAAAVRAGMRKINVGTALNIALTAAVRDRLRADAELVDPRKYLAPGRDAMVEAVASFQSVIALR